MADLKLAVPADWRLAFGHFFSQRAAHFPQIGGFFLSNWQTFYVVKLLYFFVKLAFFGGKLKFLTSLL